MTIESPAASGGAPAAERRLGRRLNQESQGQLGKKVLVFQFFPPERADGRCAQVSAGYSPRHGPQGVPVAAAQHCVQEAVLKGMGPSQKSL